MAPVRTADPAAPAEPVTVTVSRAVRPGREADFERWADGVFAVAARFPGYLGSSLLRPGPDRRDYHVVYRFADDDTLRGWHDSAERRDWLARAEGMVEGERSTRARGIEHWFQRTEGASASSPPPRWKMVVATFAAVVPVAALFNAVVGPHVQSWPIPLRSMLFAAFMVPTLTYLVMPYWTRLLDPWLHPAG